MVDSKRMIQIIAIIITVILMSMMFHKGHNDISILIKNSVNLGPAIGGYLFDNWSGSGPEKLKDIE